MGCSFVEKDFSFWMPLDVVKGKEGEMRVGGVATDETAQDIQGEIVFVDGLDVSYLTQRGAFNWDHGKGPGDILGEIQNSEKQGKKLYVEGILYPHNKQSQDVFNLMRSLKETGSKRKLGLSLEGKVKERDFETGKSIKKAWIKNVAITYNPINQGTWLDMIKSLGNFTFTPCDKDCSKCNLCEAEIDKGVPSEGGVKLKLVEQPTANSKKEELVVAKSEEKLESSIVTRENISPDLDKSKVALPSEVVEKSNGETGGGSPTGVGLEAGHDIPATSGGVSGSALRKEGLESKAKVTTYKLKRKKKDPNGGFTKSEVAELLENERGYSSRMAELMADLIFKAINIKGYVRTRKGRLERVKPFTRELTHELFRIKTMSDDALTTRARKITHPDKLLHFYHAAKNAGKSELAGYIKSQGHRIGLSDKDFVGAAEPVVMGLKEAKRAFRAA